MNSKSLFMQHLVKLVFGLFLCTCLPISSAIAQQSKVERLLQSQGVKTCLPEVRRISNFLSEGADHSSLVTSSKSAPDGAISLAHIVRNFDDGDVVATMSTAPTVSGNCSSTYTVVTPFDKPCAVVRETTMKALTYLDTLGRLPRLTNTNKSTDTVLLPVGANGCVAIKTEAVY